MMCCRKLSCLLDVVTTKSWRKISAPSSSPPPMSVLELRPNGGLASTTLHRSPGSATRASLLVDERVAGDRPEAVKQQVHRRQPRRGGADVDAGDELGAQVLALWRREAGGISRYICVRGEQESARAAGWVDDSVVDRRLDDVDHRLDQGARVKYWPAVDLVSPALRSSSSS